MNIRSLILSSLLVSGLSLGLSTSAQARDAHYPAAHHGGDHGYSYPQHRRDFRHHCKHHRYSRHRPHGRHFSRLNDHHGTPYRDNHGQGSYRGHSKDRDQYDRHGNRQHRG
jgi:hypothetical protein